jgi:hypothetical protein
MGEQANTPINEDDPRFITGRWQGFWIQGPVKSRTELDLTFRDGLVLGDGHDWVGDFVIRGSYDRESGRVEWLKQYINAHAIRYEGAAETDDGIWGLWKMLPSDTGGFQIWPEGTDEGSRSRFAAEQEPRTRAVPRIYEADPALEEELLVP